MAISDCQALAPYANAESAKSGIPPWAYLSIALSESNCTGYSANGGVGYFGISGSGPAGSKSFNGGAGPTPPLALYQNPAQAFAGFTQLLESQYPMAVQAAQSSSSSGFIQGLVQGGYASSSDVANGWPQNIASYIGQLTGGTPPLGPGSPSQPSGGSAGPMGPVGPQSGSGASTGSQSPPNILQAPLSFFQNLGVGAVGIAILLVGGLILAAPHIQVAAKQAAKAAE